MPFNLSATVNILRTLKNPALLYPQCTISTFDQLPVPVSKAFVGAAGEKEPDIRAVILDKDNCFSIPHELEVYPAYRETFERLKKEYPGNRLLIVSNSAGTWDDPGNKEADLLEKNTGVKVLRHATKKPGCYNEIFEFLKKSPDTGVTRPDQIAVVGDRLATDVLMANMMGSWAVWVKDGPRPANEKLYGKIEAGIKGMLERRGWEPPVPSSRTL
ncbi:mitochondrial PGP phosphatase [Sphaerosporella brunnea]|uniref:Mitochondrial PGP phosphatase n=1 Tax=Sphaerosporella brunnea TaxID=1250544 RepID=A0A5J5EQR5_9PEZI|nr:mitochondrial PGP phosphatase [Sphaerosporella brunnea]